MSSYYSIQIFSKKRAIFTICYGLITLIILLSGAVQLAVAYHKGEGFDVPDFEFVEGSLIFLLVAYVTAAQQRPYMAWLGFRRRAMNQIIIAEYDAFELTPAEAGVLIDTFNGQRELIATLRSLQLRGYIVIKKQPSGSGLVIEPGKYTKPLDLGEQALLDSLSNTVYLPGDEQAIHEAFRTMHQAIAKDLMRSGYLLQRDNSKFRIDQPNGTVRVIATLFQLMLFIAVFMPGTYRINYPRYPLYAWELAYNLLLPTVLIGVTAYSYFSEAYSRSGWDAYRKAAGLYLYLKTALQAPLKRGDVAQSDLIKYQPYALAFGLVEPDEDILGLYL